jgi:hypothetical protein
LHSPTSPVPSAGLFFVCALTERFDIFAGGATVAVETHTMYTPKTLKENRPLLYELRDVMLRLEKALNDPSLKATLPALRSQKVTLKFRLGMTYATDIALADEINAARMDDEREKSEKAPPAEGSASDPA